MIKRFSVRERERDYKLPLLLIMLNLEQIERYTYNHRIDKVTEKN